VAAAHLSLFKGKLELIGLQLTDPGKPTHDQIRIGQVTADLSVRDLLAKRFAIDLLEAGDIRLDVARSVPGAVHRPPEEAVQRQEPADSPGRYFAKFGQLRDKLRKLEDYLKRSRSEAPAEAAQADSKEQSKEDLLALAANQGYLSLSAQSILAKHPAWLIRKMALDGIVWREGAAPQRLEGAHLSSHPGLHREPMTVKLSPSEGGAPLVDLAFRFDQPGEQHRISLNLRDIALGQAIALSKDVPLDVQHGRADLQAAGGFLTDAVDVPFTVTVKDLQAGTREGRPVLGMDPNTAREAFKHLDVLTVRGSVVGALASPRIKLDTRRILADLKDALIKAGKAEIAGRVGAELKKVTGEAAGAVQDALGDKLPGGVAEGLGRIVPGLKSEKGKDTGGNKSTGGIADGLRKALPGLGAGKDSQQSDAEKDTGTEKREKKNPLRKLF